MPQSAIVAASAERSTGAAARAVVDGLQPHHPSAIFAFHAIDHDPQVLAQALGDAFPRALVVGCSTGGELSSEGALQGGVSVLALLPPARAVAEWIEDAGRVRFDRSRALVGRLAARLGLAVQQLDPSRHLLLTLTDGLSGNEETLIAALNEAAPGIPLVGGSAGDDQRYLRTVTFVGAQGGAGSAVVALLEPRAPFRAFAVHHFRDMDERVVVTSARPERRRVSELNGWPAVDAYARIAGVPAEQLRAGTVRPGSLPVQLGFRVGDDLFIRGVMAVRDDELILGGAVDEGMVLRAALAGDLVEATRLGVARALVDLEASASALLLFNCLGRHLQVEAQGREAALHEAMAQAPVAGFNTYGEQFGSLQVNYTLTGVVFGERGQA